MVFLCFMWFIIRVLGKVAEKENKDNFWTNPGRSQYFFEGLSI